MATKKSTAPKKKAKKAPTKKSAAKKSASRKSAVKKAAAKKKAPAKKSASKKKVPVKKSAPKKTASRKKAPAKKPATRKKAAAKKAAAKKTTAKKAPARKTASKKAAPAKKAPRKATATKVAPAMPGSPIKPPVTKKKKNDRRVAPTVVPSRRKLQKKAESEAAAKSPRRKIDFANPRSVAAAAASSEADKNGYVFINGRRVRAISTKGAGTKKKRSSAKTTEVEPTAAPKIDVSKIKTKMSKKDLDKYRDLLILRRREIMGMVSGLETEALRSSGGNLSNMPVHMADVGSDVFEQDFTLGMAATEREMVVQIDAALTRIADKTYGVCQSTGKAIPRTRLNAKPWAKYTVEAARAAERGLGGE